MSKIGTNLETVLKRSQVHIKHPDIVRQKISALIEDGTSCLQVISDFDMTISKYKHLNKKCPSSHRILELNSLIPDEVKRELADLKDKYYAIEIDHNMTNEEKVPHMEEWWSNAHRLISKSELKRDHLRETVSISNAALRSRLGYELYYQAKLKRSTLTRCVNEAYIFLRDGCEHMIDSLHKHNVPLLIFSAGIGDVLEEVIRQKSTFHPNIKIVSNFMEFDAEGTLVGFKGDLIHTFNKDESVLKDDEYFETIKHRHNIIMMGDMLGDLTMANGVPNMKVCLKIGFLNAKFDELLEPFMDAWDIVLVDDQTMDITNGIVDAIIE